MYSLTIAVFGAVVLCTTCGATKSTPGEIKEYLLIDFVSNENSSDVNERFKDVIVVQKFKFYVHQRYLFLVENDKSVDLKELRLPEDACDVKVVPVETIQQFHSHFGVGSWDHTKDDAIFKPFDDGDFTFSERTWMTDENFDGMEARIRNAIRGKKKGKTVLFAQVGAMPIKLFILAPSEWSDYELTDRRLHFSRKFGGIHVFHTISYKIHTI